MLLFMACSGTGDWSCHFYWKYINMGKYTAWDSRTSKHWGIWWPSPNLWPVLHIRPMSRVQTKSKIWVLLQKYSLEPNPHGLLLPWKECLMNCRCACRTGRPINYLGGFLRAGGPQQQRWASCRDAAHNCQLSCRDLSSEKMCRALRRAGLEHWRCSARIKEETR